MYTVITLLPFNNLLQINNSQDGGWVVLRVDDWQLYLKNTDQLFIININQETNCLIFR